MKVKYIRKDTKVLTLAERKKPPSSSWSPGGQVKKKKKTSNCTANDPNLPLQLVFSALSWYFLLLIILFPLFIIDIIYIRIYIYIYSVYSFFYFMSTEQIRDQFFNDFQQQRPAFRLLICATRGAMWVKCFGTLQVEEFAEASKAWASSASGNTDVRISNARHGPRTSKRKDRHIGPILVGVQSHDINIVSCPPRNISSVSVSGCCDLSQNLTLPNKKRMADSIAHMVGECKHIFIRTDDQS